MLFFFNRLTFGLKQQMLVKWLAVAVGVTYLAVFLTITFACFPTRRNWQVVPHPGLKCTFKPQNFYVCTVLNVVTDAAILAIPLPLMWALQVSWKKEVALMALLSSGVFVITAAIICIVMTLVANPSALTINRWGVRKTIAGIIAVNIPIIKPSSRNASGQETSLPVLRRALLAAMLLATAATLQMRAGKFAMRSVVESRRTS
jgi:hypothetical protein